MKPQIPQSRRLPMLLLAVLALASTVCHAEVDKALLATSRRATAFVLSEFPKGAGSGTAFCIDSAGIFITCNHVVTHEGKLGKVKITLNPGTASARTVPAAVVSNNADMDVAILRIEHPGLLATVSLAPPANLTQLHETADVLALGYPFGDNLAFGKALPEVSFSPGRITALRHVQETLAVIQFDGSINPGNSGGPLLDDKGNVIGIVQAIIPGKQINFAIPSTAAWVLLARAGVVLTPRLLADPQEGARISASMAVHATGRLPVPDEASLAAARKLVKEVFSTQYADKSATGRANLGSAILERAMTAKDDPSARYAMLSEARDTAAAANDQSTAYYATAMLCDEFDVKSMDLMKDIVTRMAPRQTKAQDAAIAAATGLLVIEAMALQQDFDGARKLIPIVRSAAAGSINPTVIAQVRERLARIQTQAASHDSAMSAMQKLKTAPDDPDANLAAGRYDCFILGDWSHGLPFLVKGGDAEIKALAVLELSRPTKNEDVIRLGDGWWDLGAKQTDSTHDSISRHAVRIYSTVLASTSGLRKDVIDKRVAEFPEVRESDEGIKPESGNVVYLTDLSEAKVETFNDGYWSFGKNGHLTGHDKKRMISVNGLASPHGLGLHPRSHGSSIITYNLGKKYANFSGSVGFDDSSGGHTAALTFRISGDGREIWRANPMSGKGTVERFSVDVSGVDTLQIIEDCAGDHVGIHAAWIEPMLTEAPTAPATNSPSAIDPARAESPTAPPTAPGEKVFLSDLREAEVSCLTKDWKTRAIKVNGVLLKHAFYLHPPSDSFSHVSYDLGGGYSTFDSTVTLADDVGSCWTPLTFKVIGDGKTLWESKHVKSARDAQTCHVSIAGVQRLTLRVDCPGRYEYAHATWVDPGVSK